MSNRPHNAPENFDWITAAYSWFPGEDRLQVMAETAAGESVPVLFHPLTPDIWRIRFSPNPEGEWEDSPARIPAGLNEKPVFSSNNDEIMVTGANLTLKLRAKPWRILFGNDFEQDIFRENPEDVDGLGRPFVLPLGYVRDKNGVRKVTFSFHLRPDERLYGLGEKFLPLNKMGQRIVSWTRDALGSTSEKSHKNIPFLWSTRGMDFSLIQPPGSPGSWEWSPVRVRRSRSNLKIWICI
ncbi:MAG: hypothetical protein P8184_12245 [Calditrichia bacterium]